MQPAKKTAHFPVRLTAKKALAGVLVVLVGFLGVHIVHGSTAAKHTTSSQLKAKTHRAPKSKCAVHSHKAHCTRVSAGRPKVHHAKTLPVHLYRPTAVETYAMQLMPLLDKHRHAFDFVAFDTGIKTLGELTSACGQYLPKISIMTDQADGVPHPGTWYSAVDGLHWRALGAYHDMLGALQNCNTGASNQDGETVAMARQDLLKATHELHSVDDYAHAVFNRVHRRWAAEKQAARHHAHKKPVRAHR